jgi:putative transposase
MSKHRKSWSQQQKLEIVNYFREKGLASTSIEYGVSSTSIYKWNTQFDEKGALGLSQGTRTDKDAEMQRILRENRELKAIVAEKELALRIKDSLLKKSQFLKK